MVVEAVVEEHFQQIEQSLQKVHRGNVTQQRQGGDGTGMPRKEDRFEEDQKIYSGRGLGQGEKPVTPGQSWIPSMYLSHLR